ncbi:MAG: Ku protein [Ilumatobacteraceae bacterium]|nr:Ku protein [Acidimicrobiales bacterium]MCB9395618.1 Ku protein [Acidimicrobiaceae bacterium]
MARSLWTGSIGFGLVNVPVKAYPAVRDHDVHFHRVEKGSGARVRNRHVAEDTDREVETDDIEMGFEISKGKYVTFTKDELAEIRPESTKVLEVSDFVALEEIDPVFYDRTYWLGPDGAPAAKAYGLLLAAMEDRQLVAIGSVVMRNKQYLAAIRPMNGGLAMSTMRFADEIVAKSDIEGLGKRTTKPDQRAMAMATTLIDSMQTPWRPEHYHDTYEEELRRRIKAKRAGKDISEPRATKPAETVVDLMAALEESVAAAKKGRRTPAGSKKSSRSRTAASTKPPRRTARTSARTKSRNSA